MTAQVLVPPSTDSPSRHPLTGPTLWVLLVAGLLTLLLVLALAGGARNDAAINARTAETTAEVLAVTLTRTVVQFTASDGYVHSPVEGVAYPSGLQVGQLVRVEYDAANPELVRVAGRTWLVGLPPAAVTLVVIWALALPAAWWLHLRRSP